MLCRLLCFHSNTIPHSFGSGFDPPNDSAFSFHFNDQQKMARAQLCLGRKATLKIHHTSHVSTKICNKHQERGGRGNITFKYEQLLHMYIVTSTHTVQNTKIEVQIVILRTQCSIYLEGRFVFLVFVCFRLSH